MSEAQLLELENKFILLKNHGKSLEEIGQLLPSAKSALLNEWDKSFNTELQHLNKSPITTTINRRNKDGKYIYKFELKFEVSKLDKVLWDFKNTKLPDPIVEKEKIEHLKIIEKYVVDLDFNFVKEEDNENGDYVSFEHKLTTNDPKINEDVRNALMFYAYHFLKIEHFLSDKILIDKESVLWFRIYENVLPFAIKQFKAYDFHGLKDVSLENFNTDAKWIFITGENSYGKSTLLQAIATALTQEIADTNRGNSREKLAIELKSRNNFQIFNHWDRRNFNHFKYLACYGPSRLLLQTDRSQNEVDEKSSTTYHLFNPDGILLNIEFELFKWFYKKDERFGKVISIFKQLIPNLQDIVLDEKDDKIYYIEKDGQERLLFNQLASGYRSLIAMVGDMMIRLFKTQENITNPNDLAGIVLIDELDLHWHPKWQHRLPTILSDIFPNVQFVATTHSAIPLLGAPKNSIFIKVTRNLAEGITAEKVDIDMTNLLPNHVLTSELFDMDIDDIKAIANGNINQIRTEDTMQEVKENMDIDKRLKEFELSNASFPDNLFD